MKNRTIGILGASGQVGRGAVETMLGSAEFPIVLGGRNPEKLREQYRRAEPRAVFMHVDVYDSESLRRFTGSCDVVINCAGPSKQVLDRVASACLEHGVHYVDVSGDEHLYKRLRSANREIEEKRLTFLVSAGVYPGLSEMFPAYVAETGLDEVELLELFFAGNGGFSLNAAYDIVCSIQEDTGRGMMYGKNGEASKMDRPFPRSYPLPPPAGERNVYPVLHDEFLSIARSRRFREAMFYNTYPDNAILNKFMTIKALELYKTEEQKLASARMLVEQFGAYKQPAQAYSMFHLLAEGRKDGKPLRLGATLLYNNDWNTLSGMVAANAARLVLEDGGRAPGCKYAAEGVSPVNMMNVLGEQDVHLAHSVMEARAGVNHERT
ncbi:NAD-dependent epimerase/dehydratase family protein [Xylanibacillus composti]|uniref:Epimerase n=1 Tax=Xylanibacillus composti TaxID=1572762 RepID=A0A8J4H3P3_9BACL|nr:saccharopine dehydrogenase NADP-binding domain-containing protein [Xylanibacillus composti]MDT9724552.1 NAD-dependent epimerase/dehydratase family protein [Xylanibacillus composti]GIQ70289.1 epimerase [Xylanibacillus composti]